MPISSVLDLKTVKSNTKSLVEGTLADTGGLLRLAPCWVPRSFLQPGLRIKLHPDDLYAYGLNRGGIDERWFASTTPAANENRAPDEGLSYCVVGNKRFTLQQAVADCGATLIGKSIWKQIQEVARVLEVLRQHGPDPAPHAPERQAGETGRPGGQAGVLLFPAAAQQRRQQFPLHVHGLRARHDQGAGPQVPRELEQGRQRHPRSLEGLPPASPAPAG